MVFVSIGQIECFGQGDSAGFYYPDGANYKGDANNIGQINAELEENGRVYILSPYADTLMMVGYKLFTDKPLWVLTENPSIINNALGKFDLADFMESWEFEFELKKHIEEEVLSDIFIIETLGGPTSRVKYFDKNTELEIWTYDELLLSLTLRDGVVVSYIIER